MHAELVLPALFAAAPLPHLPALELLLARGRGARADAQSLEEWLVNAFDAGTGTPPVGALTALADGIDPGDGYWLRADPVHLEIGRDGPALTPFAEADIERTEAEGFAAALNAHFEGEIALHALRPARWCLRSANEIAIDAAAPAGAPGAGDLLPCGVGARRALALLTGMQLALHGHALNQAREARGQPTINSVWLWGAGRLPKSVQAPWQSVCSDDPLAAGLARLGGALHIPLPPAAAQWLERAPRDGRHLCVFDRGACAEGLKSIERDWFAPLLQALRAGRVGMITLRVPDAGHSWETTRADLRRFWRRPRPLAAYA